MYTFHLRKLYLTIPKYQEFRICIKIHLHVHIRISSPSTMVYYATLNTVPKWPFGEITIHAELESMGG